MTNKREYRSGEVRDEHLEKKAQDRKAAQKAEDADIDERVRRSIEKHGA